MRYLLIILSMTFLNANWETLYYVDDFGDPTNQKYLKYTTYGSFDNTATTNSPLRVEFLVESDKVGIHYMNIMEILKKYPSDKYEEIKYNEIKILFINTISRR